MQNIWSSLHAQRTICYFVRHFFNLRNVLFDLLIITWPLIVLLNSFVQAIQSKCMASSTNPEIMNSTSCAFSDSLIKCCLLHNYTCDCKHLITPETGQNKTGMLQKKWIIIYDLCWCFKLSFEFTLCKR